MKKKILTAILTCFCLGMFYSGNVFAEESWSPAKFSLWPGIWGVPAESDIYGVNFGPVTFSDKDQKIVGLDFGLLASRAWNVNGAQIGLLGTEGENSEGLQFAFLGSYYWNFDGVQISLTNRVVGSKSLCQFGLGNDAFNCKSFFQFGLYNRADKKSKGLQIGFINIMEDGYLPVSLFFNYTVK